ncbi:RluA family pseudouridine synthase [Pontivivens insulae]|uniref:Pseudouridine synthase n=1 Tax=Pontivivens insulae TaxID=1639689 RepID=A0A2R8A682_9RHOB|nr:RluA family pseudouridine synthase [Pontivivens insulae]RED17849.1 ribosomal large subunit pseudouridine synthase C [Pontivivens insulae]SPF27739.1 Ribosomal large subunit pseudouridine synthase C [Pontivivens insulae]
MSGVQMLTLGPDAQDQRLDRWFRKTWPHLRQGQIEKMCRKGEIRLDGGRVKSATRLSEGAVLRVPPLPAPDTDVPRAKPKPRISDADAEMIRACVIYRDDDIIALNKPAGLAVQGGSGQTRHVDGLAPALAFELEDGPKLVHRLDKDTSGVLVLARNGRAAAGLARAFQSRRTRKIYWAAVASVPAPKAGTIRFGLVKAAGHGPNGAGEKMICIHPDDVDRTPGAKRAVSDYMVLDAAGKRTSWVALSPITGRTHQLRAHMAEIGTPIVGDGKYGGNSQTNEGDGWGAQLGGDISRKLHLHARSLTFEHPVTGARLHLTAPLPDHMARTWETFAWDPREIAEDPFEDLE